VAEEKKSDLKLAVPEKLALQLDVIAKLEKKKVSELLEKAVKGFIPMEIKAEEIGKKALYNFLDSKISFEELALIIGKDKAESAKFTKDIRDKGKQLLDTI